MRSDLITVTMTKLFATGVNLSSCLLDLLSFRLDAMRGVVEEDEAYGVLRRRFWARDGYTCKGKPLTGSELESAQTAVQLFREAHKAHREAMAQ